MFLALMAWAMHSHGLDLDENRDPYDSVQWDYLHKRLLGGQPVVFDSSIKVLAPARVEDSADVPVMVDATAVDDVQRIRVFADFNPLPLVLDFLPVNAAARLGFRIKVEQATAVRAAVLGSDGTWRVGSTWMDASGGGCTLPSVSSASPEWETRLGDTTARAWKRFGGLRNRFRIIHPMDTGLAPGIPAFFIETLTLRDEADRTLLQLQLHEPISENPVFTVDLPAVQGATHLSGRDNNGNRIAAVIRR